MSDSAMNEYDVIVLGGGAPGEHCAAAIAARGLRVAIVQPFPSFSGIYEAALKALHATIADTQPASLAR